MKGSFCLGKNNKLPSSCHCCEEKAFAWVQRMPLVEARFTQNASCTASLGDGKGRYVDVARRVPCATGLPDSLDLKPSHTRTPNTHAHTDSSRTHARTHCTHTHAHAHHDTHTRHTLHTHAQHTTHARIRHTHAHHTRTLPHPPSPAIQLNTFGSLLPRFTRSLRVRRLPSKFSPLSANGYGSFRV